MQMTETIQPAPIKELAAVVFSHKRLLLALLVIPPLLAVAAIFVVPPTYRAETELMVKTGHEYLPSGIDSALTGPTSTKQEDINSEIELLNSRALAEDVINTIGLDKLYPNLVESPPWFGTVMDAAIKSFQNDLSVSPVKLSNIIELTFDADDPAEAQKILDTFVQVYLTKHTEIYATGRKQGYQEILDRDMTELARLEHEQARIKLNNQIYDIGPQRAALIQQRVDAETHLHEAIDQKASLEQRISALEQQKPTIAPTVKTTESDDHARDAVTDLRQTEAALAARYAPDNPELQRVRAQIAAVQNHPKGTGGGKVTTAPSQLALQVDQELVMNRVELAPLQDEVARYQALVATYGRELDRLEGADTELRLNQAQLDNLQSNISQIRLHLDQARTEDQLDQARRISVIQIAPALSPDKPNMPKPLLFVAGGIVLGILAAGGMIMLAILTRRTFYTAIGLERQLGIPVLASVDMVPTESGRSGRKALTLQ